MAQAASVKVGLELESAAFETAAQRARRVMGENLAGIRTEATRSAEALQGLTRGVQGLAALAGFSVGLRSARELAGAIVTAGDNAVQLRAKLQASVGDGARMFAEARKSADQLGVSTDTVAGTVAKLGFALQGTGTSRETLLAITETMARLGAVGGASTQQITDGLQQLSQGLAKGRLDGDELRSVLENIPGSGRLIADAMGVAQGALRDLGAEGKITRDVVIQAFTEGTDKIKEQFDSLPPSLGRVTATMQNQFDALFAAVDAKLGSSSFVKYLAQGFTQGAANLTARVENLGNGPPPQTAAQAEFAQNREQIERLAELRDRAQGSSTSGNLVKAYTEQINELEAAQSKLADTIDRQQRAFQAASQQAAQFAAAVEGPKASGEPSPQSIYPSYSDPAEATKSYRTFIKPLDDDAAAAAREAQTKADQAAKTAATEARARRELLATIDLQADGQKRLADATGISAVAVQREQAAIDDQMRVLEASKKLKGEELEHYKQKSAAIREAELATIALKEAESRGVNAGMWESSGGSFRSAERESMEKLDNYQLDQVRDGLKKDEQLTRDYAEIQRDILIQPWKDLASQGTQLVQGMFDDLLTKGTTSGKRLLDSFGSLVKNTITGTASNLLMAPINQAISQVAAEAMKPGGDLLSSAKNFGTAHPYMASGALGATGGYITGSIYEKVAGKEGSYASTGGAIGGAGGAMLGYAVGGLPGALIGGALGSLGGSFLGGMFGGGEAKDNSQQEYWTGARKITYSDSSFGAQNRSVTSGILGQAGSLQSVLETLGGTVANLKLNVQQSNKGGPTVNGKQFSSADEATAYALRQVIGGTTGLTASQQTVLKNTQGRNANEIAQDLGFAKTYDDLTFSGRNVDKTLKELNDTFVAAASQATKLGLDVGALTQAHQRQAEEIARQYEHDRANLAVQVQSIGNSEDLGLKLAALNLSMQDLGKQATDLQVPIELVTAAHQRAAQQLVEADQRMRTTFDEQLRATLTGSGLEGAIAGINSQFAELAARAKELGYSSESLIAIDQRRVQQIEDTIRAQQKQIAANDNAIAGQVRGTRDYFDNLIDPLRQAANDNGALNPVGQIAQAKKLFEQNLSGAQAGDTRSLQALAGSAQTLRGLVDQTYGTSPSGPGADIRREISGGLNAVADDLERLRDQTLASLPEVWRETTADVTRVFKEEIAKLLESNEQLRTEVRRLGRAA